MTLERRSAVRRMLALPIIGTALTWAGGTPSRTEEWEPHTHPGGNDGVAAASRRDGIQVARFINTVERHHYQAFGVYATLRELSNSELVRDWIVTPRANDANLGQQLFAVLDLAAGNNENIRDGWNSTFRLADDRQRYMLCLTDTERPNYALVTDEVGLISEGRPRRSLSDEWLGARALVDGAPIGKRQTPPPSWLTNVSASLLALVVAPLHAGHCPDGGCCCSFVCCHVDHCSCAGTCTDAYDPLGSCSNCGCGCCIWCCGPGGGGS
jgi:hypothetical protein